MKLQIDTLNSLTGWTIDTPSTITLNDYDRFIAGLNSASLKIFFSSTDTVRKAIKTFGTPFDVSNYDTLIFSVWSRNKWKDSYYKASDFDYKIKINNTNEYYFPVYEKFTHVEIGIEDVTQITKIEIAPIHAEDDYIIISEMLVEKEELPIDILNETVTNIESIITTDYSNGIAVGTVASATAGATNITITGTKDFLERYAVIKIKDSLHEENLQLGDNDTSIYQLLPYKGIAGALQYSYTNATIYLQFPAYLNPNQTDIRLPGIAIWGIDPEQMYKRMETITETFRKNSDDFLERKRGYVYSYNILIDCEAHHAELIEKMSRIVRKFIGKGAYYINGRKHDITFNGNAREMRPQQGFDIIHKVQYMLSLELEENIFNRVVTKKVTTQNITVTPEEQ